MATAPVPMHRDLIGYGKNYPVIEWPNQARIAVSLVIHYEEGAELSADEEPPEHESNVEGFGIVGGTGKRSWNVDSMFEYGSRRGIWRILDLLDRHDVKATFFCSGQALERNPVAAREIVARGHEVCGHGYRLEYEYALSLEKEREHIAKAIRAIEKTTGQRPAGWNSRGPGPNTRELLVAEGGFTYDSDSYGDDLPFFVDVNGTRFLTIPYALDINDDKYWASLMLPGFTNSRDFFAMMRGSFDQLYAEGATHPRMMSVGIHLRISGRPSRAKQIEDFTKYAKSFPRVWFARRADIAKWWLEKYQHL
jgi:peptidoglycan/xylan/chitin deacetylase (PgdA/CDA1 family)